MNRQAELEERFEALLLEREEITRADLPMAHAMAVNKEESLKVAEAMRNTTEELCANLQDTPDVDANLTHAQRVRMEAMTLLSDIINDVERDGTWLALNAYNKKIAEEKAAEGAGRTAWGLTKIFHGYLSSSKAVGSQRDEDGSL